MNSYEFTIIASGLDPDADDFADRFFKAGCEDATLSFQKGLILLDFEREARTFLSAVVSAIRDVRRAGATVEGVEPSSLVSLSDIAARAQLSRAATSLYAQGKRAGGFPAPVARVTTESPLWDWAEVARWLFLRNQVDRLTVVRARVTKAIGLAMKREPRSAIARKIAQRLKDDKRATQ